MRILFLIITALISVALACWLREGQGSQLHDSITLFLGYKIRAFLEHFLIAFSVSQLPIFLMTFCWIVDNIWSFFKPKLILIFRLFDAKIQVILALDDYCDRKTASVAAIFIGGLYFFLSLIFHEAKQAFVSVKGGPPRGYIQLEQVSADLLGVIFGMIFLYIVTRNEKKKTFEGSATAV